MTLDYTKVLFYLIFLIPFALGTTCDSHNGRKSKCADYQMCDLPTSTCICLTGYTKVNETYCKVSEPLAAPTTSTPSPSSLVSSSPASHGSTVALIVVPLVLTACVIVAIYMSRKYKLASWFRRKINQRNNNYDEFMIEQEDDDPPLR